jgi:UDP-glucose 4-epimerase
MHLYPNTRKSILLTGSNGLLGAKLLSKLLESGHTVYSVVRPGSSPERTSAVHLEIDLASEWQTNRLPKNIDVVVHLAQSSRFRDFPNSFLDVFRVNVESTVKLLDYSVRSGVTKFVYASSGGVYDPSCGRPFLESDPVLSFAKLGSYLGSKISGEVVVSSYSNLLSTIILRPFFIYGPGQKSDMLIPRLIKSIASAAPVLLDGEEGISINPVHVEDAAQALASCISNEVEGVFNIAGPDKYTIRQIAQIISPMLAITPIFKALPNYPKDIVGSITRMKKELHQPIISLRNSLPELCISYV